MFDILDVELTQSVSNLLQVIILKVLPEEGSSFASQRHPDSFVEMMETLCTYPSKERHFVIDVLSI